MVIEGVPYRIVGVLAGGQIFNEEIWADAPEHVVQRTAETFGSVISPLLTTSAPAVP